MPQTPHPMDDEVLSMTDTRRAMIRLFAADGVICQSERAILNAFDSHQSFFSAYRLREIAAMSWLRNGASKLTRRRFADAGLDVIDLDAERRKRAHTVIPFRGRDETA